MRLSIEDGWQRNIPSLATLSFPKEVGLFAYAKGCCQSLFGVVHGRRHRLAFIGGDGQSDRARGKVELFGRRLSILPSFRSSPLFPLFQSVPSSLSFSLVLFFLSSDSLSSRLPASCCQNHSVCADVFCSDAGLSIDLVGARARRATLLRKPHRRRRTRHVRVPTAAVTFAPLLPQKTCGSPIRVKHAACRLLLL